MGIFTGRAHQAQRKRILIADGLGESGGLSRVEQGNMSGAEAPRPLGIRIGARRKEDSRGPRGICCSSS